jgi:uncharacterized protein DUF5916/cellulose/xylan binding protein with CBM9 domain
VRRGVLTGALAGLALGTLAAARPAAAQIHPTPPPVAIAARVTGHITLDGKLDEPDWQAAVPAKDFRQAQPNEGQPATQRTEVRFLYDDDALYIGARMYDTEGAAGIRTRLARRDSMPAADYIEIIFDTFHDHLGRVDFQVNPSGVKADCYGPNGANLDLSWDAVWDVKTRVDSLGWTAEIRIPFDQLRYPRDTVQTWGLQVWRMEARLNELSQWAFWHLNETGGPARFGHLEDLHITRGPGRGEVLPYVVGRSTLDPQIPAADPFTRPHAYDARVGGDFKYLVNSSLTLAGTVNPDFGQVEVDPAVVNLSAFETYFEEKRPFFVEGSGLFDFGNFSCFSCSNVNIPAMFYSRRIGRAPQGAGNAQAAAGDSGFSQVPDNTAILGAAKLTGSLARGWTLAALDAGTAREVAQIQDSTGRRSSLEVEPLTNYFVARVSHDLPGGNYVRALVTSVARDIRDSTLRTQLNTHAEAGGVETLLWWDKQTYRLMANATISQVSGSPADILRVEQASARYFQRPDRRNGSDGLFSDGYDSTLTALRGYTFYTRLAKDAGDWMWEVQTSVISPGFEANDVAFTTQADRIFIGANLVRQFTKPNRFARLMFFMAGGQEIHDFSHDLLNRQLQAYAQLTFHNYWNLSGYGQVRPPTLSDNLARGGPALGVASSWYGFLDLQTDARRALYVTLMPDLGCGDLRCSWDLALNATIHPSSNLSLVLGPSYSYQATRTQYVTTVTDSTATLFYGHRYVFADLVERTLSMNLRTDWTFTPDLTLQLYVQPLIASGAYTQFKEFNAPRTLERSVYGVDRGTIAYANGTYTVDPDGAGPAAPFTFSDPNFDLRSLRGSAVLRWEYHPGSTIYFVWTQERSGNAPTGVGDLALGRDLRGLTAVPPQNIFLVKFTYWLGL